MFSLNFSPHVLIIREKNHCS